MQWSEKGSSEPVVEKPEETGRHQDKSELILLTNLFQRDIRNWVLAIMRSWLFYAVLPAAFCLMFFLFRYLTTPKVYSSSCGLIRQELSDIRNSGLPSGYTNIQRQVILNMMHGRSVLEQTVLRLNLPYSYRSLYGMTSVDLTERNSNYFIISAVSEDPETSARIANTMGEVFIEDYKKLIRGNFERFYENRIRGQKSTQNEITETQQQLKSMYSEYGMQDIEREEANNNQRIMLTEDRISQANTSIVSLKERLAEVDNRLAEAPTTIITYSESNAKNDQHLVEARQTLSELRERYTDANPRVQKQENLVKKLEKEHQAREGVDETPSKVVTGPNFEYTQLKRDQVHLNGEIASAQSELKDFTEKLVELRTRRELLARLGPDLRVLEEQLRQKKSFLVKEDVVIKELELFLERSFSDISIQEPARPASSSLPRKLGAFAMIGFVFGVFLATLIVLGRELFNLTTRSETDMTKALHVQPLAIIPVLEHKFRADFYGALQLAVTHVDDILREKNLQMPAMAVIAPYAAWEISPGLFADLYDSIAIRNDWSYVIIKSVSEDEAAEQAPYLINDYLYQLSEECPKPDRNKCLYFKLDDLAFISPPGKGSIKKLQAALRCDIIFWELFDFELHRQLFMEITKSAELTIIPMRYEQSSKLKIFRMLRQFRLSDVKNVFGLLFDVSINSYRRSL
jgi:capsular polysaccharide biosynthesis protein